MAQQMIRQATAPDHQVDLYQEGHRLWVATYIQGQEEASYERISFSFQCVAEIAFEWCQKEGRTASQFAGQMAPFYPLRERGQ